MGKLIALSVLWVGCSSAALPVSTSDAFAITWEQTYGMDRASRPIVEWHDECRTIDATGNRATSIKGGCIVSVVNDNGRIELQEAPMISDSSFTLALEEWKRMLIASEFAPIDGAEVRKANDALIAAGM